MKSLAPLILAGALLALAGCTTDSPIFATDASKAKQEGAGPSNQEQARDVYNQQNSGAGLGSNYGTGAGGGNSGPNRDMINQQAGSPYGH